MDNFSHKPEISTVEFIDNPLDDQVRESHPQFELRVDGEPIIAVANDSMDIEDYKGNEAGLWVDPDFSLSASSAPQYTVDIKDLALELNAMAKALYARTKIPKKSKKQAKHYKLGEIIKLVADDLVCLRSGEGAVVISDSTGDFKETLSIPLQCLSTPQEKDIKGWFSTAKKSVLEVDKEGMPEALRSKRLTTSLITLNGLDYFVLENSSWHTNKNTLPLTLQILDSDEKVINEYKSYHFKTSMFFIPKKELEGKNEQSLALKVMNKFGSELLEPTRFSLKGSNKAEGDLVASDENMALNYQLEHLIAQLNEPRFLS